MNNDETFEFENRVYVNPDISRDEQTAFVDTLRDLQAQKNAQIATETHNLGTDVEPHLGGLSGSEEYWQSKYQTPQVNAMVADMKAVAQQSALNTALQNYQNALQNQYQQAYRNYQRRAYNYNRKNSGGGGGNGDNESTYDPTKLQLNPTDGNDGEDQEKDKFDWIKNGVIPPNPDEYYVSGEEQTKRIQERSGMPDWLVNVLKIFG